MALRNLFAVGHFKKVLIDAKNAGLQKDAKDSSADVFYYRAMIALGAEEQVIKAIPQNASTELQAVKLLATYKSSSDENRELVLDKLKELRETGGWTCEPSAVATPTVQLLAALIWYEAKNYKEALRYVHKGHEHLEHLALTVQIYLKIDRLDLAARQVKSMQDIDDDDALTTLATTWLYIAMGGEKVQEAYHLLEELVEKFTPSTTVLNTMAVCQIAGKNFVPAFAHLRQARELALTNKEKISPETFINSLVCLQQMNKAPELTVRIIAELKQTYPGHPWLARYNAIESVFDKYAVQYAGNTPGIAAANAAAAASATPTAASGAAAAAVKK